MLDEISAAVRFLVRLIEKNENFNHEQLEHFKKSLSDLLIEKFENHWFPEKPDKGQGYRCIRVNGVSRIDSTLEKAASACGIKYEDMNLPCELTIWVDPNEVCCRFGETRGSFCTLASFDKESSESSSGSEDSLSEDSIKEPPSPPTTPVKQNNQVLVENKQRKNSGGRNQRGGGNRRGNLYPHHHQHPLHGWYNLNLITPPWLPPSPPPYSHPPAYRHKWSPHRYTSAKQAALKV